MMDVIHSGGAVARFAVRPGETGKVVVFCIGGAVAQLGARLDGIEEVVGSNPIGSTKILETVLVLRREANDMGMRRLQKNEYCSFARTHFV
jgi:hypothetical protein